MDIDFKLIIIVSTRLSVQVNDLHIPRFVKEVIDTMSNYSQKYFNTVDYNSAKRKVQCNINGIKLV